MVTDHVFPKLLDVGLDPDVIGEIEDVPYIIPHRGHAQSEAIRPLAAAPTPGLEQLGRAVVARESADAAAGLAMVRLDPRRLPPQLFGGWLQHPTALGGRLARRWDALLDLQWGWQ